MRLKVGDDFLDSDNSIIAQTYAVNEIGKIETSQGGFSNDFTLPLTDNNRAILGFPDDINSSSRNPYTKVEATLIDQGATVAQGYLKYQIVNNTQLQCSFFADNVNWFNDIKGKSLKDLDLTEFDHIWNGTNIDASFTNTEGYIYPFIDYGGFQPEVSGGGTIFVDDENWLPSVFIHTIIERIFFEVGWKIQGPVVNQSIYNKMLLPFSLAKYEHQAPWIDDNSYSDTATVPHAITTVRSEISWVTAGSNNIVWTNESAVVKLKVTLQLSSSGGVIDVNGSVGSAGGFLETVSVTPTGTQEFIFLWDKDDQGRPLVVNNTVQVPLVDEIRIGVQMQSGTGTVSAVSTIEVIPTGEYAFTTTVNLQDALPDIQQSDFINSISFGFGGLFQANPLSKTITWSLFRDLNANLSSADDWSNKIDLSKTEEVNFTELVQNYAQNSILTYSEGENDNALDTYKNRANKVFGQGSFTINNDHLAGEAVIFQSQFAPTINQLNTQTNEVIIPSIPHYIRTRDSGTGIVTRVRQPTGFRLLLLADSLLSVAELSFNVATDVSVPGVTNPTSIPYTWFEKETLGITAIDAEIDTLAFESSNVTGITGTPLKDRYLGDYEGILNSMRYLKAFIHLTEVDISNLDFTIPVYIEQFKSYFYKSKILNYQGRKRTTEAELTKIG